MIDSAHEDAWRFLIRYHIERGDRVAAIGTDERCCAALSAQCQVGPFAETEKLIVALSRFVGLLAFRVRLRSQSRRWTTCWTDRYNAATIGCGSCCA